MSQKKQNEWKKQWEMYRDDELFLFKEWIFPNTLEDFKDKEVLECGCGGGQHTCFVSPYAKEIVAVDLNTSDIARKRNENTPNARFLEADIMSMDLGRKFDVVFSVGVVHHTDDPDKAFANILKHAKEKGKVIVWVYSKEGNFLVRSLVEPFRKVFLSRINKKFLSAISNAVTFLMYIPVYTLYLLPFKFLPYYEYFKNFRRLSFSRNSLNVFDKLNAPQVTFISKERISGWFNSNDFKNVHIENYKGVSWRASGIKNG